MKNFRLVLYGHFGSGNIGNDSSLEAALQNIKNRLPSVEIFCVCDGPKTVAEKFGIKTIPIDISEDRDDAHAGHQNPGFLRRFLLRVWDELQFWIRQPAWFRSVDQFIVVGTGAVDDIAIKWPWNAPYDLYKWCKCAKLGRVKVIFLSVGVGPIKNKINRFLMLKALKLADYRSYREIGAFKYLQSLHFDTSSDHLFPDLVFSLDKKYLSRAGRSNGSPVNVGVGMLNYSGWEHDPSIGESVYQEYLSKMKQFVVWLLEGGYSIRLLRGDKTDDRPVDEIVEFVRKIGTPSWQTKFVVNAMTTVDELFEEIACTDVVIASRFHNILSSLMLGRPVISLGYHDKNLDLLTTYGLERFCQHIEEFTVQELMDQFEDCRVNADKLMAGIDRQNRENRLLLARQYDMLLGGIDLLFRNP